MNTAIRDGEHATTIWVDPGQFYLQVAFCQIIEELVVIQQFHFRAMTEEARIICEDASRAVDVSPGKDPLVVGCADNLQLKPVKRLLPLSIQYRHIHVQQPHQRVRSVLHSSRPPIGCPRHDLSNTGTVSEKAFLQYMHWHSSNAC